jgi:hypothetical protein
VNIPVLPPKTYSEWLEYFNYLKSNRFDNTHVSILKKGSLQSDEQLIVRFQNQLTNLLNTLLEKKTKKFIKEFNYLIECNEMSGLVLLFKRFQKDVICCLFFDELEFLSDDIKLQLSKAVRTRISEFIRDVIRHLKRQTLECNNSELEDALYQIKRIKIFS